MTGINILTYGEYPHLWERGLIQARIRELANHRCEHCGMEFHQGTNLAVSVKRRDGHPLIGTVHHVDGNKANCSYRNLVYLCQRCHYTLHLIGWIPGKPMPRQWFNRPPLWVVKRGLPFTINPQLVLFDVGGIPCVS